MPYSSSESYSMDRPPHRSFSPRASQPKASLYPVPSDHGKTQPPPATGEMTNTPDSTLDFERLITPELSPNKRAIIEAVLSQWQANAPQNS